MTAAATQEIFAAAGAAFPLRNDGRRGIAVLDRERTERSALVVYYNTQTFETYRFRRAGAAWQRGARVESGSITSDPATTASTAALSMPYSGTIAQTRTNGSPLDLWQVANRGAASYKEVREYVSALPTSAEFIPNSMTSGDTTFTVSFDSWTYSRKNSPTGSVSGSCGSSSCVTTFNYTDSNGFLRTIGSERLELYFRVSFVAPLQVSVSGISSISQSDNYTWTAAASGGDGTYSYSWQYSTDGNSWSPVGSSSSYTRYVRCIDSTPFYVRANVTSAGSTKSATHMVVIDPGCEDPLQATITGPTLIESTGYYTWTGSAGGGKLPYSYTWQFCAGTSCSTVATGTSYSTYVNSTDPSFTVKLQVNSQAGQMQSTTTSMNVHVAGGGGGTLSVKPKRGGP